MTRSNNSFSNESPVFSYLGPPGLARVLRGTSPGPARGLPRGGAGSSPGPPGSCAGSSPGVAGWPEGDLVGTSPGPCEGVGRDFDRDLWGVGREVPEGGPGAWDPPRSRRPPQRGGWDLGPGRPPWRAFA